MAANAHMVAPNQGVVTDSPAVLGQTMEGIELMTAIFQQQQQWLETWRLELQYVFSFFLHY
jgi:hypothetical protein